MKASARLSETTQGFTGPRAMCRAWARMATVVLCASSLAWIPSPKASAQTQVRILEPTERISAQIIDGEQVRKITGSVRLEVDGRIIMCDSAFQYIDRPVLKAFGVKITDERESIAAERLDYDTQTEIATFTGDVRIVSDDYRSISDTVSMNLDTSSGTLLGRVQWMDSTRYAEADRGYVEKEEKRIRLAGQVYGESFSGDQAFRADSIEADSTGRTWLWGSVWLKNLSERSVEPDSAEGADAADGMVATTEWEETQILADAVFIHEMEQGDALQAFGAARVWSERLSSVSDSLDYDPVTGRYRLLGSPVAWRENLQLSADWMDAMMEDEDLRELKAGERPVVVIEDTLTGRLNQLSGDTLHVTFADGEIQTLILQRKSEIVFHQTDAEDRPDGAVKITSEGLARMDFEEGEVRELKGVQTIDGFYLPEGPEVERLRIQGFRWDPELRPQRQDAPARRFFELYPILRRLETDPETSIQDPFRP